MDVGQSFNNLILLVLVILGNSDKICARLGLSGSLTDMALLVLAGIGCVLFGGFVLDRCRFAQMYNREANARNEDITAIRRKLE